MLGRRHLVPGTSYQVRFTLPSGYVFSPQNVGSNTALDSDPARDTGMTASFTAAPGEALVGIDAGTYLPAFVTGIVWLDGNGNGKGVGDSELTLPGLQVQ